MNIARVWFVRIEAALLLTLVAVAVRVLPYQTVRRWLDRYVRTGAPRTVRVKANTASTVRLKADTTYARQIAGTVSAVARRLGTKCLPNALAADAMLRRRGYESHMRLGVRPPASAAHPLESHAWVEHDGIVVLGALDDLGQYVVMSRPWTAPARIE